MGARTRVVAAQPPASAAALPARMRVLLAVLCGLLLMGLFSREIYDTDFWWHLRTGQYIVEQRALPAPDHFAWTTAGARDAYPGEARTRQFNLTHEWLAQAIFYGVWRVGGEAGTVVARALTMTGFCGLVGLIAWRRRGSYWAALAAALACASVAHGFAFDRPYHFTWLFLAATLAILEFRRPLWLLPPLFLVWANCHSGYFLGWGALGAWCVDSALARRRDWALYGVSAASVVASALNPNGLAVFGTLWNYQSSYMTSRLMEWARPVLWPASAFSVLLAAALIALVWSRRQVRVADWLLFVGFAAAALTAQRNLVLAGIVAPIMLASYLPWKFRVPAATPLVVAVLLAGGTVWGAASGSLFQFRAAEWKIPRGAADFLVAHQVPGPLFNTYEYGGYLIWRLAPRLGVFIDGRALSESVFQDYARILYNHDSSDGQTSGEELLERYGVQTIVMNTLEASNGLVYLLAPSLADPSQSKWKLVYDDAEAVVFVRTLPPGVTALNSLDVLTHMENECAVHLAREPEYPRCARALGQIFGKISDYGRARKWIGVYLGYPHAPDAEARDAYRRLLEMGQ